MIQEPSCRVCNQPLVSLDEDGERWYCWKDDELYYAKEQRWVETQSATPPPHKKLSPTLDFMRTMGLAIAFFLLWLAIVYFILLVCNLGPPPHACWTSS